MRKHDDQATDAMVDEVMHAISVLNDRLKELGSVDEYILAPRNIWLIRSAHDEPWAAQSSIDIHLDLDSARASFHMHDPNALPQPMIYDENDREAPTNETARLAPEKYDWYYGDPDSPREIIDFVEHDLLRNEAPKAHHIDWINSFDWQKALNPRRQGDEDMAMPTSAQEVFDVLVPAGIAAHPEKARELNCVYCFKITGEGGADWTIDLTAETPSCTRGASEKAQCTISISAEDFKTMLGGDPNAGMQLFFAGKLVVAGDVTLAMKLQQLFELSRPKA